jgi:hypothetical protein
MSIVPTISCPRCRAKIGDPCRDGRGGPRTPHQVRITAAREAMDDDSRPALRVSCPRCNAKPTADCVGGEKTRRTPHAERRHVHDRLVRRG